MNKKNNIISKYKLTNLPVELQKQIFSYAFTCKKNQNFFINKNICKMILNEIKDCDKFFMLNKWICKSCHKEAFKFIKYYAQAVF